MVVCQLTIKSLYCTYLQTEVHEHADCGLEACMCTPVDGRDIGKNILQVALSFLATELVAGIHQHTDLEAFWRA